jgi:hypothetical protein
MSVAATLALAGLLVGGLGAATAEKNAADFPDAVKFEQGATKFLEGDNITITEVRGTADSIMPGNIYCIKGTCKLTSHNKAMLAAYITAQDSAEGTSKTLAVQTASVNKGDGAFTLYMPMYIKGWPHVSFYPADGGSDFGGNYFGTGDYVLKQWWGEKATDKTLK